MADEINDVSTENQEPKQESAGCLGIGLSFVFPIIGFILYFSKRRKYDASPYLINAILGIVLAFF